MFCVYLGHGGQCLGFNELSIVSVLMNSVMKFLKGI